MCKGESNARKVAQAMHEVYKDLGVDFDINVLVGVNEDGVRVMEVA